MVRRGVGAALALSLLVGGGCTPVVYRGLPATLEGDERVAEEDVTRAFDAKPQLPERIRVAYFTFNEEYARELEGMLRSVPQIVSLYRIPTYVATGQRRFEPVRGHPVGIDRLRLAAARARAQVVLVLDYGYQSAYRANGLAFLGVALVPLFFVPLQDVEAESYLDAYVVDTRNGYFYGQLSAARRQSDRFHTLYSNGAQRLVELQRGDMLAQIGKDLGALFSEQRTASRAPDWGLDAPLPSKSRGTELVDTTNPWADSRTVPIELTLDGKVAVGEERTQTLAEFVGRLRKLAQEGPLRVVVTADKRLPYGRVAEVIALVREVGVKAVVLGGEPGDTPDPVEPKAPPKPPEEKPAAQPERKPYSPKRL